jgi:tetratricopeptide (TPR) repeat protein
MTTRDEHSDPVLERLVLDQRPGPAARISSARANALVQAAMNDAYAGGLLASEALDAAGEPKRTSIWQAPWLRATALAAVGLLMLVGGAAAAKLVIEAIWEAPARAPLEQPAAATPQQARKALPPAPLPEDGLLADEPEAPLERAAPKTARRDERELDAISEDLLQAANRARAAGQFRDAADTYAEVYERHPSSLSAYVAEVAAGSLELEHLDRPDRAARLFRRALRTRPAGALDLEARQGLAIALRDLGRERDEIAALKALVAAHPERPAAQRARARLAELSSTAP